MNAMMSQVMSPDIPQEMRNEHAAQNMEYVFTDLAEEQDKATKNQFKVF